MSDPFCSSVTDITAQEFASTTYRSVYHTTTTPSCLPQNGQGFSSSDITASTGIVSPTALSAHVNALLTAANAVPPSTPADSVSNTNPASRYSTNAAALRTAIRNEYCFYYKRYKYLINLVLSLAVTEGTDFNAAPYTTHKTAVIDLNTKLNQILQIMQGIVSARSTVLNTYYTASSGNVNSLNTQIDTARNSLMSHMGRLQNSDMEEDVKKSMVDYTLEKNASSRNLLAIYGFMNIVAVGMLVYLYRSSK